MNVKRQNEISQEHIEKMYSEMRVDLIKDIKSVGKELAIDIVSLNKKIDSRSNQHLQRMVLFEATLDKFDKRTMRLLK